MYSCDDDARVLPDCVHWATPQLSITITVTLVQSKHSKPKKTYSACLCALHGHAITIVRQALRSEPTITEDPHLVMTSSYKCTHGMDAMVKPKLIPG